MKISTLKLKETYNLNFWRTRLKMSIHQKKVKKKIGELLQYYQTGSIKDFSSVREKFLVDLLKYAKNNSIYYSKILCGISNFSSESIDTIPFLTKQLIRENGKKIKSKIVPDNLLLSRKTGGSTGEPLKLWSTGNTEFLHQSFLYKLFGYQDGDRILAMDGTLLDENLLNNNIFWKLKNEGNMLPYGGVALSSLYLNSYNINEYIKFITEFKPDFIRGYPSFITEIASYIIENRIDINFQIKAIEVTSEICTANQVKTIRNAFRTKVIGQYGQTEACVFGYTIDETMVYYCSPFYGFTEIIGNNNKHVNIGEEGEIVATGFSSFGFPLIRYRTGDRAIYGGIKNGIVILNSVQGRTADYIITDNNEKVLITALVFGQHYKAFSNINRWQIIQDTPGSVVIVIDRSNDFTINDEEEISKIFSEIGKVRVTFDYGCNFVKTKTGKVNFVVQNLQVNKSK